MGATSQFRCQDCGYSAEVDDGGGFLVSTMTAYCRDCRELREITVARRKNPSQEWRRTSASAQSCPVCRGTDLTPWADGDLCPRCGGMMTNEGISMYWD